MRTSAPGWRPGRALCAGRPVAGRTTARPAPAGSAPRRDAVRASSAPCRQTPLSSCPRLHSLSKQASCRCRSQRTQRQAWPPISSLEGVSPVHACSPCGRQNPTQAARPARQPCMPPPLACPWQPRERLCGVIQALCAGPSCCGPRSCCRTRGTARASTVRTSRCRRRSLPGGVCQWPFGMQLLFGCLAAPPALPHLLRCAVPQLAAGQEATQRFKVAGGSTLEVTLGQFWSSLGDCQLSAQVRAAARQTAGTQAVQPGCVWEATPRPSGPAWGHVAQLADVQQVVHLQGRKGVPARGGGTGA